MTYSKTFNLTGLAYLCLPALMLLGLMGCDDQKQGAAKPIDPATMPQWVQKCQSTAFLEREEAIAKLATLEAAHHAALEQAILPLVESNQWHSVTAALAVLSHLESLSSQTQTQLLSKLEEALNNADPDLAFRVINALKQNKAALKSESFKRAFSHYMKSDNRKQRILIYRLCTELPRNLPFIEDQLFDNLKNCIKDKAQFEESHEILTALSFTGSSQSLEKLNTLQGGDFHQLVGMQMGKTIRSIHKNTIAAKTSGA